MGATIDDAAGEAFDKVARLLGLPFPGGPYIDRAAREGNSVYIDFPRGLTARARPGAAPLRLLVLRSQDRRRALGRGARAVGGAGAGQRRRRAASRRPSATCWSRKALDAATSEGIEDILIGGGVAANSRLRAMAEERAAAKGIRVRVPRPGLCTDNGAMVAALGAEMVARGRTPSALDLPADSSLAGDHRPGLTPSACSSSALATSRRRARATRPRARSAR